MLALGIALTSAAAALIASSANGASAPRIAADVTLTCADESPPGVQPHFGAGSPARKFGPLALDGVGSWASKRPVGVQVVSRGRHYSLLKAYVYILRRPPSRVSMTILSPTTAGLYYVSGTVWASRPSAAQIVKAAAHSVRFSACAGPTGYTGGLLIAKPACITLRVGETGLKARTVRIPIAPARCRP